MNTAEGPLQEKLAALTDHLRGCGRVALGFSGGVDSTFLAAVLARSMPERALLVQAVTPFATEPEAAAGAQALAADLGGASILSLPLVRLQLDPRERAAVAANLRNRCYHCKRFLFENIVACAHDRGFDTVIDGSNADDLHEDRPGMRALAELGVRSPLQELGWSKSQERSLLRAWGWASWDMPANACLATRIATGEQITDKKLARIREAERALRAQGHRDVRVRLQAGEERVEIRA